MRIVVIGHGMVGSRFAADIVRADPPAQVTVLGQEDHQPYNRVMLSSLVAGRTDAGSLALETESSDRLRVLRGVRAVGIDRARREVTDARGELHTYDRLVLATGSAPRIPDVAGLRAADGLAGGISALKDLDDARRILETAGRAERALVLGAGVLGLEVATGLAARGLRVTLVHHRDRLMERQLDPDASEIARTSLERLGIDVVTGVTAARATLEKGRVASVELSDGSSHPAQLMVLCAGTVPHVALASEAGLECDRGIVVGHDLATTLDPAVFAIGDCAQPPEGASGLVAQGWEHARRLVESWTPRSADAPVAPAAATDSLRGRELVRVKAVGFALVAMGRIDRPEPEAHAPRSVRLSDPSGGRYTEVVVQEGRLIAATVIGDDEAAASLSAAFTRRTPVPRDPVHLLARPLASQAAAPVRRPQEMDDADVICQCNGVTKGTICGAIRSGCATPAAVSKATRAGTGCGTCRSQLEELIATDDGQVPAILDPSAAAEHQPA
ncbi:FAD-dependent oxidoreductase [Brachybacterium sp. GCM10030268]|uniref:FAD-dependent oxidoreductase n=1 Tax=Brachybacterium sp. GCM10030268 TaxID=3273382 RepID=UPI0036230DEF